MFGCKEGPTEGCLTESDFDSILALEIICYRGATFGVFGWIDVVSGFNLRWTQLQEK